LKGYGLGTSSLPGGAIKLAKARASQSLLQFDLYDDRTIYHNFYEEYYYTKLYAEKRPQGHGLVCHRVIKKLCELIGIKDIYVKLEGSRNAQNMTKAFISGLLKQVTIFSFKFVGFKYY
jgi:small subunit ribosomal protein S5